jgi:uncharacterized membrane protein
MRHAVCRRRRHRFAAEREHSLRRPVKVYPFFKQLVLWSIVLYAVAVAVACWLPVVWLQIRMHKLAREAVRQATPLPQRYFQYLKAWTALGVPAFFAFVGVFWLMVVKPSL